MSQMTLLIQPFLQFIQIPYELLLKLAAVGIIIIVTWIVSRALGSFVSKAVGKLSPSWAQQARRIVSWLVWLAGILIALDYVGLELTILLVILSLGGITLAIAIRDILSDMVSREVITAYNLFKIGDWIQVGKCFGRVVDITWTGTILMTVDNEMVYIPNSKITKNTVINRTSPGETRISVSMTVDEKLDLNLVEKTLLEIGAELKEDLAPGSKPEVRVTGLNNHTIKLALLLKINNPAKDKIIASEVRKRAKIRLDEIKRRTA